MKMCMWFGILIQLFSTDLSPVLTYTLSIHNLVAATPTSFMGSTLTVKNASEKQFLPIMKEWMPIEIGGKKLLPLKVYSFMITVQIFRPIYPF